MNDKNGQNSTKRKQRAIAKNCAYIAVFVALTIAAQLCFAAIPGVELVTVLFVTFSFAFGCRSGMIAATAFSLLRQLVFGFSATVLLLYLIYFNLLALLFGFLGKYISLRVKCVPLLTVIACVCTIGFTMLDNVLTPWWLGYSGKLFKMYFWASFSFMLPQVICTAISVGVLFYPLAKFFKRL
jgi:hypothetical protein